MIACPFCRPPNLPPSFILVPPNVPQRRYREGRHPRHHPQQALGQNNGTLPASYGQAVRPVQHRQSWLTVRAARFFYRVCELIFFLAQWIILVRVDHLDPLPI